MAEFPTTLNPPTISRWRSVRQSSSNDRFLKIALVVRRSRGVGNADATNPSALAEAGTNLRDNPSGK